MILQNLIFPSTDTCTEEKMYFRRADNCIYTWAQDYIAVPKGAIVEFDTYFNGFSAEKWFKYTNVKTISLTLKISGSFRVTLMRKEKIGAEIHTEFCGEYVCENQRSEPKEFTYEFKSSSTAGMFCFLINGMQGMSKFYGGNYNTDIPESSVWNVKVAIDICTYKRERFIEANLRALREKYLDDPDSVLHDKLEVFVSDNAQTLDKSKLESENIHIYKNKNVGGAGGFTRGIIEIYKKSKEKNITHILVMDDDVRIEPESIYRTCTLLMCLKEQYKDAFIGGAMLRMDRQYFQVESGAVWNSGNLVSYKQGLDLNSLDACLFNEFEERTQFNAWWYCAFPVNIINDTNLPMPIFIRGDDVEFGLRNMRHLILMNGICVWHEPFENKYSSFLYYYILRNRLIDNSLHNMTIAKKQFKNILYTQVCDEIRIYRYKNARLLMRGVEDFLKGVNWLAGQDGEALHKDVMENGYKLKYLEDLEEDVQFQYPLYEASLRAVPVTDLIMRAVNYYTLNGTYLPPKRSYAIVPTVGVIQSAVYRTETVLNYDYASKKGFVTKRSPKEARACMKRLKALYKLIDKHYDDAVKDYAENYRSLTSMDYWEKYLELESK